MPDSNAQIAQELVVKIFPTRKDNASILNREIVQNRSKRKPAILTALQASNAERDARVRLLEKAIADDGYWHYDKEEWGLGCIGEPTKIRVYICSHCRSESLRKDGICYSPNCLRASIQRERAGEGT